MNIARFFYLENQFPEESEFYIIGKIVSLKEESEYYNKYKLKIINNNLFKKTEGEKIIIYVKKEITFFPGDIIKCQGIFSKAEPNKNYKGFNYKNLLKQNEIFGILQCENTEKIGYKVSVYTKILDFRLMLCNKVEEIYSENSTEFLKGLLLGKVDGISEKIKVDFENSNISHILAISGMHVSYVLIGIQTVLNKTINNKKIKNYLIIVFFIFFYFITGETVSCLRASIMISMIFFSSNIYRKNNFYTSFIISLTIIIIANPYNIYNIGMWLSYFGTLGIVIFYKCIFMITIHCLNLQKVIKKNKLIYFIIQNFCVSVSAQVLIFPIMLYAFNVLSVSFFIPNILISFFIVPVLILGYLSLFISFLPIPFYKIIVFFEEIIINIILNIAKICAKLPLAKIYVTTPYFINIIGYYLIVFVLIKKFKNNKNYFLKFFISKKLIKKEFIKIRWFNLIKNKKIITIILLQLLLNISYFNYNLKIYFVDVGQGDCTFIQTPKRKNIIIDGGEGNTDKYDYGENVLLPYLLDRKIKNIDYMIISHTDSDHIGGLFAILENIKVNKILIGIQPESSKQFSDLLEISNKKGIEIVYLKANDRIYIEDNIKIDVIWPLEKNFIEENILNNNSLVFKFYYKDFSILFTGDIEGVAENDISKMYGEFLKSDILKVAHHGSKTSTTKEFLSFVRPKVTLIGVGKNNKFGHPDSNVINKINLYTKKVYRTDIHGEIIIEIKDNIEYNIYIKLLKNKEH